MKVVVATFNQEKALVGAFSMITNFWMDLFGAHTMMLLLGTMLWSGYNVPNHSLANGA